MLFVDDRLKRSDPFDENTFQGPQVSQTQYDRIMNYVECGKQEGAKVITGGKRHGKTGFFIEPVSSAPSPTRLMPPDSRSHGVLGLTSIDLADHLRRRHGQHEDCERRDLRPGGGDDVL